MPFRLPNVVSRIRGNIKKAEYQMGVLDDLMFLLEAPEPAQRRKLLSVYPGIRDAIASNFEDGDVTPQNSALSIATILLTQMIETKVPEEARKKALDQLFLTGIISHSKMEPIAWKFEWFRFVGEDWIEKGKITEADLNRNLDEIVGALKGIEFQERSKARILRCLDEAFSPFLAAPDAED